MFPILVTDGRIATCFSDDHLKELLPNLVTVDEIMTLASDEQPQNELSPIYNILVTLESRQTALILLSLWKWSFPSVWSIPVMKIKTFNLFCTVDLSVLLYHKDLKILVIDIVFGYK